MARAPWEDDPIVDDGADIGPAPWDMDPIAGEVAPRSGMDGFRMGMGDVAQGVGDLVGIAANPLAAGLNATGIPQALTGGQLGTDAGGFLRSLTGAPAPQSDAEKMMSAAIRGGTGALAGAGLAQAVAGGLTGAAGKVAAEIGANPVRDLIAGLAGGIGAEAGEDIGGLPGALVGGLAGSIGGLGVARLGERAAEAMATRFPRSAMLDASGGLTEDAREIALRTGADPEEIAKSYARVREGRGPRPTAGAQARREANRGRAVPEQAAFNARVQSMLDNGATLQQIEDAARAAGADPAQFGGLREAIAYRDGGGTERVRVAGPQGDPTGTLEGKTARIMGAIEQRLPQAAADGAQLPPSDGTLFGDANSQGIRLTRGQAEQDFGVQNDENSLRVSASRDGNAAREFFTQQQDMIRGAVTRFREAFGDTSATSADRGQVLKDAVTQMRDGGAEGVRQLYRNAEALGGGDLRLDTAGIRDAATDVLIDEAVPEGVKRAVSQELARYGIIGEAAPMNETGLTRVTLEDGSAVQFRGPVKDLSASNAEDLRKAINRLYDPMRPNQSGQTIKPAIDDALEAAITGLPEGEGQIGAAYQAARAGYREQKQTFAAKDIIESLIANRKGTDTPVLLPERAIAQVIGAGAKAVSNLAKTKNLLLSGGTPSGRQAWQAIQQQALADIFDGAIQRNVNTGGDVLENVSGAKLRTMIFKTYGTDKLRAILEPDDFNELMKLQRVIGAATIPLSGTVNPSGTATKLINFLGKGALRFTGGLGDAALSLASKAKDAAQSRKTLRGITSYDGPAAQSFLREYIESGKTGRLVPSTISLAGGQSASLPR